MVVSESDMFQCALLVIEHFVDRRLSSSNSNTTSEHTMLGVDAKDDGDVSSNPFHVLEAHYLPYRMRCVSDIHQRDKQFSANYPLSIKDPSSNIPRDVSMRTALPFFQMWYVSLGQSPLTNGTIHIFQQERRTHL